MKMLQKWLKISAIFMLMTISLNAATPIAIDTEDVDNGGCPGELISILDSTNTHYDVTGQGVMNIDWDVDRYRFQPGYAGTVVIKLNTPQEMTIKAGTECNTQDYFRSNDALNHTNTFHIEANQGVYLSMFDWETDGYTYNLSIEFIPDNPDTSSQEENETTPTSMTIDTQDSTNGDCSGEFISVLDDINENLDITGIGVMNEDWDVDRYRFKPNHSGTITINLNTSQNMTIKAGSDCDTQTYYRSNDAQSHTNTFHIQADETINLTMFDWDTGNGYDYDLNVKFQPDNPDTDIGELGDVVENNNTNSEDENETIPTDDTTQTNTDYTVNNLQGSGNNGEITHPTLTNDVIGTTKGSFSVNQGAANYSLDITVPPGRAGMQPKISLDYNSNAGDGYLGKGWGIGGLSIISRCPSTKAVDGFISGVDLNKSDRYCLNGQRLIKISDNPIVDGDDSAVAEYEYRTEIDHYSKVVSYNSTDYGPRYWRVWTKSGLIYEYGNSDGSRVKTKIIRDVDRDEAVISWAVNKIEDRTQDGNDIDFTYYSDTLGERYIDSISYVGGEIDFQYKPREKNIYGYMAGTSYQITQRLDKVVVNDKKVNGSEVRSYDVRYKYSSNRDIIDFIQEKADGIPLKTLKFQGEFPTNIAYTQNDVDDLGTDKVIQHIADINGDGKPDFVFKDDAEKDFDASYDIMSDVNGDGYLDHLRYYHKWDYNIFISYGSATGLGERQEVVKNFGKYFEKDSFRFADIDADGVIDIIACKDTYSDGSISEGGDIYVSKGYKDSSGKLGGFGELQKKLTTDYISYVTESVYGIDQPIKLVDLNGDGLPDILHFSYNKTLVSYNNNGNFEPFQELTQLGDALSYEDGARANKNIRTLGDVNGDGLLDIVAFGHERVLISINTGTDFLPYYGALDGLGYYNGGWRVDKNPRILADMNNDGRVDIVAFSNSSVQVYLSNGTKFLNATAATIDNFCVDHNWDGDDIRTVTDYNGDGTLDIVGVKEDGTTEVYIGINQVEHITRFYNDKDQDITINYQVLNSIYTKGTTLGNDIALTPAMQVVESIESDDGIGDKSTTTYKYENYKINRLRGSLGFGSITQINDTSNTETITNYEQNFPYIGMTNFVGTHLKNSAGSLEGLIAYQTFKFLNKSVTYNSKKVYRPYAYEAKTKDYLTGISTVTKNIDGVDEYGNIKKLISTKQIINQVYATTTTTNTYTQEKPEKWLIGRLTSTEVEHDNQSDTRSKEERTKNSSFTYDLTGDNPTGMLLS